MGSEEKELSVCCQKQAPPSAIARWVPPYQRNTLASITALTVKDFKLQNLREYLS